MNEQDFKQIGEMIKSVMDEQRQQFRGEVKDDLRLFRDEIVIRFDRAIGTTEDNVQHKLDLVVEGQQSLVERMDRLEGRMERLENRVDGIAIDLSAHRRDTEAHRKGWRVREDEGEE